MTFIEQFDLAQDKLQKAKKLFAEAEELLKNLRKSNRISEGGGTTSPRLGLHKKKERLKQKYG